MLTRGRCLSFPRYRKKTTQFRASGMSFSLEGTLLKGVFSRFIRRRDETATCYPRFYSRNSTSRLIAASGVAVTLAGSSYDFRSPRTKKRNERTKSHFPGQSVSPRRPRRNKRGETRRIVSRIVSRIFRELYQPRAGTYICLTVLVRFIARRKT